MVAQDFEFGWGLFQNGAPVANATNQQQNTIHALIRRTGTSTHVPGPRATVPNMTGGTDERDRFHFNAARGTSFIIPGLMTNEAMRGRLANMLSDLVEISHAPALSRSVYDYLRWCIENEHRRMMGQGARGRAAVHNDEAWDDARNRHQHDTVRIAELPRGVLSSGTSPNFPLPGLIFDGDQIQGGHIHITSFLAGRGSTSNGIPSHIGAAYSASGSGTTGLGLAWASRATVTATVNAGAEVQMGAQRFGHHERDAMQGTWTGSGTSSRSIDPRLRTSATGRYWFSGGASVPLVIDPWPGYRVRSVTGATNDTGNPNPNAYRITAAGTVTITMERDPAQAIEIFEIRSDRNGLDDDTLDGYITLRNNGSSAVNVGGWTLTDDGGHNPSANPDTWAIPEGTSIAAGQTLRIGTRESTAQHTSEPNMATFRLDFGERVRLNRADGTEVQMVDVSLMRGTQVQRRGPDGKWRIDAS
jgi:hypothetical protein